MSPKFTFGVFTDVQYADAEPSLKMNRYYRESLPKLEQVVQFYEEQQPDFVLHLGDLIDRKWESYDDLLPVCDRLSMPLYHVAGNHDFIVPDDKKALVNDRLGIPAPGYYSFFHKGWRFVMLNGNEISTFSVPEGSEEHKLYAAFQDQMVAEGRESALYYNGTLSETQMSWFRQELEAAEASQEHVLICCHYPTYPEDTYNLWHSREVVEGIGQFSCVRAYFNGHRHAGGYAQYKGCHYLTFLSVLDVPELTAWSMVEVFEDRLEVKGFGKEEDRTLRY